jgi:hypothetical protein
MVEDLAVGQEWLLKDNHPFTDTIMRIEGNRLVRSWVGESGILGGCSDTLRSFAEHARTLVSLNGEPVVHHYVTNCGVRAALLSVDNDSEQSKITCPVCIRLAAEREAEEDEWRYMEEGEVLCEGDQFDFTSYGGWKPTGFPGEVVCAGYAKEHRYRTRRPKSEAPQQPAAADDHRDYPVVVPLDPWCVQLLCVELPSGCISCSGAVERVHGGRAFAGWVYACGLVSSHGPRRRVGNRMVTAIAARFTPFDIEAEQAAGGA